MSRRPIAAWGAEMFGSQRKETTAEDIADAVLHALVLTPTVKPPAGLVLDGASSANFKGMAGIYQLAAVMQVFLEEGHTSVKISNARIAFDKMVFGFPSPDERQQHLVATAGDALSELRKLLHPEQERSEMSWGLKWLQTIGVANPNPVHAGMISVAWLDFFIDAKKALRKLA